MPLELAHCLVSTIPYICMIIACKLSSMQAHWRWRQHVPPKCWHIFKKLQGTTCQKTVVFKNIVSTSKKPHFHHKDQSVNTVYKMREYTPSDLTNTSRSALTLHTNTYLIDTTIHFFFNFRIPAICFSCKQTPSGSSWHYRYSPTYEQDTFWTPGLSRKYEMRWNKHSPAGRRVFK